MNSKWCLLAMLLATATATATSPIKLDLSFHAPAQAAGDFSVRDGEWALLVFAPGSRSEFVLHSTGGIATNYTDTRYQFDKKPVAYLSDHRQVNTQTATLPRPFHAIVGLGDSKWSILYLEAQDLDVDVGGADAVFVRAEAGAPPRAALPHNFVPPTTIRGMMPGVPMDSAAIGVDSPDGALAVMVAARNLRLVHWYNATITCQSAGHCPAGEAYRSTPIAGNSIAEFRTYTELRVPEGELHGQGSLLMMAVGGSTLEVDIAGAVRFPDAVTECPDCMELDHQTFTSTGSMHLDQLQPQPGSASRLQTSLAGYLNSAAADELPFPNFPIAKAATGAAVATGVAILFKIALAFFTRGQRPALDNPRLRHTFGLIIAQPGRSFSEIRRLTAAGTGDLKRQLGKLLKQGLVVSREYRNSLRFFENHGRYDANWQGYAALQNESTRMLHAWLLARPGSTQIQMRAAAFGKGTIQKSLKRLESAGLVSVRRHGRYAYYWAVPVENQ